MTTSPAVDPAFSNKTTVPGADFDFAIRDISTHEAGRHQIRLAEHEMPGLMALREQYGDSQPLKGARIAGSLHMTVRTESNMHLLPRFVILSLKFPQPKKKAPRLSSPAMAPVKKQMVYQSLPG